MRVFNKRTAQARYACVRTFLEHGMFCDWDALFLQKARRGFMVEVDWQHVHRKWNAEHPQDPVEDLQSLLMLCRRACQGNYDDRTAYWRVVCSVTPSAIFADRLATHAKLYGRPLREVNGLPSYARYERELVPDGQSLRVQSMRSRQVGWTVCEPKPHCRAKLYVSENNPCFQLFRHIR